VNTDYLPGGQRFAMDVGTAAAFLFGCFTIGVFSCRDTTPGTALVGLLFCFVVYLTKKQWIVWLALFTTFASVPDSLHIGKDIGPVTIYLYQVTTGLAVIYLLIPISRLRRSDYILPVMFLATIVCYAVVGFAAGNPIDRVLREFLILLEVVGGCVFAMLIIDSGYVKEAMRAIAVTLWFSAGMLVASSFHFVRLNGRTEHLEKGLGALETTRLVTNTQTMALAVLTALIAAQIITRVRPATYLMLAPPALIIALLSFARHILLLMGVAAIVALIANPSWPTLRRTVVSAVVSGAIFAATLAGSMLLLRHSAAGAWLGDQFTGFNNRVFGGISHDRLAMDPSILDRKAENNNLHDAIGEAPVFGHGLGYPYQLPSGKPNSFEAGLGTTYAHNFYLWWLAKSGAVGMTAFALFAVTAVVRALFSASVPAKIAAALTVALLVNSAVDPIPEGPTDAMVLGLALGATLQFALARRRARRDQQASQQPSPSGVSSMPATRETAA
jgi:O-antigen ligase